MLKVWKRHEEARYQLSAVVSIYIPPGLAVHFAKLYSVSPLLSVVPLMKSTRRPSIPDDVVRRIQTHVNARRREREGERGETKMSLNDSLQSYLAPCTTVSQLSSKGRKWEERKRRAELLTRAIL